jgi:hypothetical protein
VPVTSFDTTGSCTVAAPWERRFQIGSGGPHERQLKRTFARPVACPQLRWSKYKPD